MTDNTRKTLKILRKDIKASQPDEWDQGSVLRFTLFGRYTYAAIKLGRSWYLTGVSHSSDAIPRQMEYFELVEMLTEAENVCAATEWTTVKEV